MGNLTYWVPSTYLPAHFHALSQKMALSPFRAHQPIYRHFHGCPFWNGKFDLLGPINLSTGTFSRTIPKNGFDFLSSPLTYIPASSRIPILEWEIGPIGSHQPIYWYIFMHYPIKWFWVPFEPINLSTDIFTDSHSGRVPSMYLLLPFYALFWKITNLQGIYRSLWPPNWRICFGIIHILSTGAISQCMQIFFWLWLYIVWGGRASSYTIGE